MSPEKITVLGAGLAGAEAAWQIARRGVGARLVEMRPLTLTPAHRTGNFAELVCSNSFGSALPDRAAGQLQWELEQLDSLILAAARATAVPAGGALAVDREQFALTVTEKLSAHPLVEIVRAEARELPAGGVVVVASGPLTGAALSASIAAATGERHLYFYDALAPIVSGESVDLDLAWRASRYGAADGDGDYLNCPLNDAEYNAFVDALTAAETIELRDFEKNDARFFEGCLPIEVLAARGRDALAFGPLSPKGLDDPRTGRWPRAVAQLRQDNAAATLYNLVGFQTNLKWGEQERVLRMIPGLQRAEFVRLGQMHRNTFINAPLLLTPGLELKTRPGLFFGGQLTGAEGYLGNVATGLLAGVNAVRRLRGEPLLTLPATTMSGALCHYLTHADSAAFQPMKANFGLLPPLPVTIRGKRARYAAYASRAREDFESANGHE
ncbi:MAG: methylenetetrahydrofolate--tRNA-(uracil(54)-C(5))-methyltransferase (FADH(2)-oxidizing) TrmFO [Verrucomicrobiales bacterium]|jgi:methylenetetrahydrofolate--tRNA-(uracil-5-)-methyltransferase|nr:methylenetetrahydrofolate--tRNA-(uracil(54)-C(5))-methyltransferase (FADH(2)-oxidizing) TrmFO [Verrucomicrobiales bacterium]